MNLERLKIKNFKGIEDLSIKFFPKTNIYGDNAVGKTTVYDAWLWLLFGKDSQNKTDFEIKPIRNGQVIHNVETSVEAVIRLDGKEYTFKKIFKEKWTKKRGQATAEFTGHTTDHYINGVPRKKSEYTDAINNIIDEKKFKILSSVTYFNEILDWKERRQVLFELSSIDQTDSKLAENLGFNELAKSLNDYTIDDYKKMLTSSRKKINDELKSIPIRIDELNNSLQEVEDVQPLKKALETLKKQRADLMMQPAKNPIDEQITKLQQKIDAENQRRREMVAKLQPKKSSESVSAEIKMLTDDISALEKQIEQKRQEWFKEDSKQPTLNDTCPCCGQALPPDYIDKAVAEFNKNKSEKLSSISAEGKRLAALRDEKEKQLDSLRKELIAIENAEKEIEAILTADIPELQEIQALLQQKEQEQGNSSNLEKQAQIEALTLQIEQLEERIAKAKAAKEIKQRITELEKQEKELAVKFAEIEDKLNEADKFIAKKVEMIEKQVASNFEIARFKLFDIQINGGINETCETVVNGIPYRNLNNAAKINVGLDIIKTLQKHYGITIPVFIDNAESVNKLIDMGDTQVIRLIVSKNKELVIEED